MYTVVVLCVVKHRGEALDIFIYEKKKKSATELVKIIFTQVLQIFVYGKVSIYTLHVYNMYIHSICKVYIIYYLKARHDQLNLTTFFSLHLFI